MKNRNLPFATTQIDLEGIILSEISQTEAKHYVFEVSEKKKGKLVKITTTKQTAM